ncbi:kunitz-like toxin PcKuz3 [Elgaria multicarinata webbii]|uniref:kunitz-like toxin PcKuz3 n=1 Tax=Elgaria multicarinata webbii TaxID=159646 RepID=UPI002FCD2C75
MQSGGSILLVLLLAISAELTLVSGHYHPDFCHMPVQRGLCYGYHHRFFYKPSSNQCKSFIYGGCGGNKNNFRTFMECQRKCIGK